MCIGGRLIALTLGVLLVAPLTVRAHNESVHQRMTDYAYHVLLASARFSQGGEMSGRLRSVLDRLKQSNPSLTTFFADAAVAIPKLRALKSGLPLDPAPCITPALGALFGLGSPPNWKLPSGTNLAEVSMSRVRLPVNIHYGYGAPICMIDERYVPSGALESVNPGSLTERDYTGVTLGYWAAAPDKETKDWVLRSTTLETLQNPFVVSRIAVDTTVAVSTLCVLACGLFPPACVACPAVGIGVAGQVVDEFTSIDADSLESEDYVGLGHFIDMKPTPADPPPFDSKPAKLIMRAGPKGVPDLTEDLVTALFDLGGIHVNHAKALAPTNYQITLGASGAMGTDFHPNSINRTSSQWELPTVPHLQLTAVDNLAMFGYEAAKMNRGSTIEAKRLGWPLHALGDASVPMHTVGASGYGHRPYEDSVDMAYDALVGSGSMGASVATVRDVIQRAFKWRKFIQDWRRSHQTAEVPVRDLVTAVAKYTRQKSDAQPSVFQPIRSLQYIVDEDAATAGYDTPAMAAIQRDLLLEGIAAEVAFLMAVTEVAP